MYDSHEKPSEIVCPQEYCFNWVEIGDRIVTDGENGQTCGSIEEALAKPNFKRVVNSGCNCRDGTCARLSGVKSDTDWYEPSEPALKAEKLPWFFFIPGPSFIVEESREEYISQSEALWGEGHWLNKKGTNNDG